MNIIQPNFDDEESEDANFYSDRPLTGQRMKFEDIELSCIDESNLEWLYNNLSKKILIIYIF